MIISCLKHCIVLSNLIIGIWYLGHSDFGFRPMEITFMVTQVVKSKEVFINNDCIRCINPKLSWATGGFYGLLQANLSLSLFLRNALNMFSFIGRIRFLPPKVIFKIDVLIPRNSNACKQVSYRRYLPLTRGARWRS